jgi:D-ornithine 4,5-aminomutase subunit alpha
MNNRKIREDNYLEKRKHLSSLSDEQLKQRFWQLAEEAIQPLVSLAYKNTTPAIERSILLRMGFSSLEAKDLVEKVINHGLISKGAGHVVYRLAKLDNIEIRTAGLNLINNQGWEKILKSFEVSKNE